MWNIPIHITPTISRLESNRSRCFRCCDVSVRTPSSCVADFVFLFSIVDSSRATDVVGVDSFSVDRNRRDVSLRSLANLWQSRKCFDLSKAKLTRNERTENWNYSCISIIVMLKFVRGILLWRKKETVDRLGSSIVQCFYSRERCQWLSNIVSRLSVSVSIRNLFS